MSGDRIGLTARDGDLESRTRTEHPQRRPVLLGWDWLFIFSMEVIYLSAVESKLMPLRECGDAILDGSGDRDPALSSAHFACMSQLHLYLYLVTSFEHWRYQYQRKGYRNK